MKDIILLLYVLKLLQVHALIEHTNLNGTVAEKSFVDPDISKDVATGAVNFFDPQNVDAPPGFFDKEVKDLESRLGAEPDTIQIDLKSGRVESLTLAKPILPGDGQQNTLLWTISSDEVTEHNGPISSGEWEELAIQAVQNWMSLHESDLDIDVDELFALGSVRTAVHGDGEMIQLSIPRMFRGVPVLGSRVMATIKQGNLINVGLEDWGTIPSDFSVEPMLTAEDAYGAVSAYSERNLVRGETSCEAELKILTMTPSSSGLQFGQGYVYVLVWRVCPMFEEQGSEAMEGLVDAQTGKIYSFIDQVHYFEAKGGVYPIANDNRDPDGIEQPNWPMPYMNVDNVVTDTGGNYFRNGNAQAKFMGPYVFIEDNCGGHGLSSSSGVLDWGSADGTDCECSIMRESKFASTSLINVNSVYRPNPRGGRLRQYSFFQN